jgi:hypothetical protein
LNDEKKAVEKALDDLLWTEFVVNRRRKEEGNPDRLGQASLRRRRKQRAIGSRTTALEVTDPIQNEPVGEALQIANLCWGVTGLSTASTCTNDEAASSASSSSSSSSSSEGNTDALATDSEEECGDGGTTDPEPNDSHLCTRITVTQTSLEENMWSTPLASPSPLVPTKTAFQNAMKPRNARYRVHFK